MPSLEKIQGHSWRKLVSEGSDPRWRTSWFYEYNYEKQFPYTPNVRALRTDKWKFIRYPHGDGTNDKHSREMYDLEADPNELHNLAKDSAYLSILASLETQLTQALAAEGQTPDTDKIPIDEGIKTQLPDQKIR